MEEKLNSREHEATAREEILNEKEIELKVREKEYRKLEKSVKGLIRDNEDKLSKLELDESISDRIRTAEEAEKDASDEKLELRAWENKLARIDNNQDDEAEKLADAKRKLELEKKTYKEDIKKEFFDLLEKKVKGV